MSERFFVATPVQSEQVQLSGDEARHLASVMRAKVGDTVTLFDGSGAEFMARVSALDKRTVELDVLERREISREAARSLTLAVALPKGDRQKWLVEKTTELGVARLIPLITEHGVAQPTLGALDRLRRTVIEASKQCGRNRLMAIEPPLDARELFALRFAGLRLLAQPDGGPPVEAASESEVVAAIGPEGGFSRAELASAAVAGWQTVSLGPQILRVETAALALAAWNLALTKLSNK